MASHFFIVDKESYKEVLNTGIWKARLPSNKKKKYEIMLESMRADLLSIRKNDRAFFYEKGNGFHGVFKIVSGPYENFSIQIKPEIFFEKVVSEERAFHDVTDPGDLWAIKYKKTLMGGKATNHITPEEEEKLIRLLCKVNDGETKIKINSSEINNKLLDAVLFGDSSNSHKVKCEKTLEKWLIKNVDNPNQEIIRDILGPVEDIGWFANYLPCTIMGGSFDIVVFHKKRIDNRDIRYKISLIELKKGKIDEKTLKQADRYKKYLAQVLANGDEEMVQIILIGNKIKPNVKELVDKMINRARPPILVEYRIESGDIKFKLF